jgi:hypothetical protein
LPLVTTQLFDSSIKAIAELTLLRGTPTCDLLFSSYRRRASGHEAYRHPGKTKYEFPAPHPTGWGWFVGSFLMSFLRLQEKSGKLDCNHGATGGGYADGHGHNLWRVL